MKAYYNEFDPKAAAWLRQLIKNGLIMDGIVDDRSIIEVQTDDLKGFTRHHFFAGVGGWEKALELANWPIDRPVCTASLPCQPFSVAGAQKGKEDERHLLPHFIELVKQCNFQTIFGEQVPGAIKHGWLDDLCTEMEREKYTIGSIVLTASGAGAPHIRQRLYWVADNINKGSQGRLSGRQDQEREAVSGHTRCDSTVSGLSNTENRNGWSQSQLTTNSGGESRDQFGGDGSCSGLVYTNGSRPQQREQFTQTTGHRNTVESTSSNGRLGNTEHDGHVTCQVTASDVQPSAEWRQNGENLSRESSGASGRADATSLSRCQDGRTEWDNPDWLYCRDEKYRPIKPGIEPLANGLPRGMGYSSYPSEPIDANNTQEARVMRLKGYGNAIVPQVAAQFIQAFMNVK